MDGVLILQVNVEYEASLFDHILAIFETQKSVVFLGGLQVL